MATFFIEQFGCRATQADAAAIERQLRERGHARSADAKSADVVVVNTCTVTLSADMQARQAIHAIYQRNPAARIVVTGCYAQREPEQLSRIEGVAWVVGNSHQMEIPRLIDEMMSAWPPTREAGFVPPGEGRDAPAWSRRDPARILIGDMLGQGELLAEAVEGWESGHTRPVLKIQDGCDSRCSYCVIPQVRGRSRSLAPYRVIAAVRKLAASGAREVVLSGIDLGSYGRNLQPQVALCGLLRRILEGTLIERLRVSSIEPTDVSEEMIALFAANERLARHFHMPLQSGSNRILAAMRRWYRAEHYACRAELVRKALPDAAIGADVITGFPGETEEDHRATLAFLECSPLTHVHVFSFSARPGTPAATMQDQISRDVISRRAQELRAMAEAKKRAFHAAQAGHSLRVLTLRRGGEDAAGPWTRALSGNYLDVRVVGRWPANRMLGVRIESTLAGRLTGQPLPVSSGADNFLPDQVACS